MTKISKPFYTRANGAVKCTETKDGYAMTVSYGSLDNRYVLTTYFAGLDDMAEYIYFTAAKESESVLSIMADLERHLGHNGTAASHHETETNLVTFEEEKKAWAEKGYTAVKGSEATEADKRDTSKVIIYWA